MKFGFRKEFWVLGLCLGIDSFNHCLMDSLVLLANEEDMLRIMHEYGIQSKSPLSDNLDLFEILNFQRYLKTDENPNNVIYQSFMGDTKINEKVTVILNQIIAVMNQEESKENIQEEAKEEVKE